MAEQEDLSQLMPTLYSRIRFTSASDETAGLALYAAARQGLAATASAAEREDIQNGMLHEECQVAPQPRHRPETKHGKGTGRVVAPRGFDLQLRLPQQCAMANPPIRLPHGPKQLSLHTTTADMDICSSPQPSFAVDAEQRPETATEQDRLCQQLSALHDISNARHNHLKLRQGSGRDITKRGFGLALPDIAPVVQQQPQQLTPKQMPAAPSPAHPTPAAPSPVQQTPSAHASLAKPHSIKSRRSSFGSAVEGVLERPWRSIGKTNPHSRFATPGTALRATPMEGILERFEQPGTVQQRSTAVSQQARTPVGSSKPEAVLRLQLSPGDEAQLLHKESPVQGLLEPQLDPAVQHSSSCAHQQHSLGFFGSLNTAPMLFDTPGAVMQNDDSSDDDVEMDYGFADEDDISDGPVESPAPSTANATACSPPQPHSQDLPAAEDASSADSPASAQDMSLAQGVSPAQHVTPASQQPPESSQHLGLSVYGSGATHQGSIGRPAFSPAAVSVQTRKVTPHFREMQVQTGSSLPGSPALPSPTQCDAPGSSEPAASAAPQASAAPPQADGAEQEAQPESVKPHKAVRKSEAHQRLKESNRQRRSLAGEGLQGDHGVRRSSRSKHAPLEYWRNERKVYNREFRSLPTVHHYATRTPSPSWKFVQDLPHKKRSRLAAASPAAEC